MDKRLIEKLIGYLVTDEGRESSDNTPFEIGKSYFIRTVTYHLTGVVVSKKGKFLILKEVAVIFESDRFTATINDGKLKEVEPVNGEVFVNMDSITDVFEWKHPLPRKQI